MKNIKTQQKPCDGTIPKGWEMPEYQDRIQPLAGGYKVDLRGLKAPAPLVGTLKILSSMEHGQYLEATYPLSPIHLFPHLMEEGWSWEIISQTEEGTCLKIFKESDAR